MSNYPANTKQWKRGDIVIHDADEKHPKMLMIVRDYDSKEKLYKTQYVDVHHRRSRLMRNDIAYLHDPQQWGINPQWGKYSEHDLNLVIFNWDLARYWNHRNTAGCCVWVDWADGAFYAKTKSTARINENGEAVIDLIGKPGYWLLEKVFSTQNDSYRE
jgi:hypothetical protein